MMFVEKLRKIHTCANAAYLLWEGGGRALDTRLVLLQAVEVQSGGCSAARRGLLGLHLDFF